MKEKNAKFFIQYAFQTEGSSAVADLLQLIVRHQHIAYMRKTSSVAVMAIWAKKNWPKNGLKWPKIA